MHRATNSKADGQRAASLSASNGERAGVRCRKDGPPKGNANYANGSMPSSQTGAGDIQFRKTAFLSLVKNTSSGLSRLVAPLR